MDEIVKIAINSSVFKQIQPTGMSQAGSRWYFVPYDTLLCFLLHSYWDYLSSSLGIEPARLINGMSPMHSERKLGFCFLSPSTSLNDLNWSLFGGDPNLKGGIDAFLRYANRKVLPNVPVSRLKREDIKLP